MANQVTLKTMLMLFLLTAVAFAQQRTEQRTFTGTWTCVNCSLAGLVNRPTTECEDLGHRHCLRLDNGKFLFFLDNERGKALIQGGGRRDVKMTVKGTYYANAHTIDVQSYVIEGITTTWNQDHQKMEMQVNPSANRVEKNDTK